MPRKYLVLGLIHFIYLGWVTFLSLNIHVSRVCFGSPPYSEYFFPKYSGCTPSIKTNPHALIVQQP